MDKTAITDIRTFYRIVWTNPPLLEDFQSHQERGIAVHVEDAEILRISTGISVFRTLAQARKNALKRPPWFGRGFIARIVVPIESDIAVERTTKSPGHYTIWADAALISSWVEEIEPVAKRQG